jgi:hypothetical protein
MPAFGDGTGSTLAGEFRMVIKPEDAEVGRQRDQVTANEVRSRQRQAQITTNGVSSNIVNLQRRAAGDLPVRVDVPRTGNSYQFLRPLVLDEETKVTFRYKTK